MSIDLVLGILKGWMTMPRPIYEHVGNQFTSWLRNEIRLSGKSFNSISMESGLDSRSICRHYEGSNRPFYSTVKIYWEWSGRKISLDELWQKVNLEWMPVNKKREEALFPESSLPKAPFADWLADQMYDNGYTCRTLAKAVGVSREAVWNHANGFRNPKFSTVQAYCKIFGEENPFKIYEMVLLNEK